MEIEYADLNGNIHIGVSMMTTEEHALVPMETPSVLCDLIAHTLNVKVIKLAERIIGSLIAGNSNGFVISNIITKEVMDQLEETNLPIYQVPEFFAFGNVILVNDNGGIISPIIPLKIRKRIQDTLEVPFKAKTIANSGSWSIPESIIMTFIPFPL